jgi:hypothetical protein
MGESIAEFMDRRRREVASFGREAEAAAYEAYRKAIRAGHDLRLGTQNEVMAYGAMLLRAKQDRFSPPAPPAAGSAKTSSHQMIPREAAHQLRNVALQADTAIRGAANVLTFRGADHLAAGMDASILPGRLAGWDRRYQANLSQEHARNRYDKINRPVAQATGQVAGALLGLGAVGPMAGALAVAPRLAGAAALTGREGAAILATGGATGFGMQMLSDGVEGRRSSLGDNLGAIAGGVAGAAALPFGPARAGAISASATSAAQDIFNGRPVAVERAGESAIAGNLLGGVAGVVGRGGANALPQRAKGLLGETLGDIRSTINGQRREWGPKARDEIYEGGPYWYPDGRTGSVRFEDKFGVSADLSPNQTLAQSALGSDFRLYHFLPADIGKVAGVPAAGVAPHMAQQSGGGR